MKPAILPAVFVLPDVSFPPGSEALPAASVEAQLVWRPPLDAVVGPTVAPQAESAVQHLAGLAVRRDDLAVPLAGSFPAAQAAVDSAGWRAGAPALPRHDSSPGG